MAAKQVVINLISNQMKLTTIEHETILEVLKVRFNQNMNRHKALDWSSIEKN